MRAYLACYTGCVSLDDLLDDRSFDPRWPALDAQRLAPEVVPFPVTAPHRVRVDLVQLRQSPYDAADARLVVLDRRDPEYARAKRDAWRAVGGRPWIGSADVPPDAPDAALAAARALAEATGATDGASDGLAQRATRVA